MPIITEEFINLNEIKIISNNLNNNYPKIDVLLTNGWDRIAYNILRGLRKEGLNIAFGTDKYLGMGYYSKYSSARFIHHNYKKSEELFIEDVISAISKYNPTVYIPTGEEIFAVSRNLKKIEITGVKLLVSDINTLESLNNKVSSFKIVNRAGVPTPETIVPQNSNDIYSFIQSVKLPVIIKKGWSRSSEAVAKLDETNIDEFEKILLKLNLNYGEFIVQKFVEGNTYGVSLLMNRGKTKAIFTHKRLREKIISGGPSTLRISTRNLLLEDYAVKILESVKYHGVAMVEFKLNEQTGEAWFIEVNPRFWGSVGLAINSGVNFPYLLYKMALEGDVQPKDNYKEGVVVEWWLGDKIAFLNNLLKGKIKINSFSSNKHVDYYDDFYKDDPLPFFAWIYLLARRKFVKLK